LGQPIRRVLVVDDNRDGASSMAIVLRLLGNDVKTAYDGIEAIKIIALTGWGQEKDHQLSQAAGCDGHLVKPVNLADLQRMLAEISGE